MTKTAEILASAYNTFGPRSGDAATPATVRKLATRTQLRKMVGLYLAAAYDAGPDALFTVAEIDAAFGEI